MQSAPPSKNDQVTQRQDSEERNDPSSAGGTETGDGAAFPIVLHQLLEDSEQRKEQSIVSWSSCGKMMKVHDKERFSSLVMPRFFRQSVFKSFQRQLNLYSFERIRDGPHRGYYFHALFIRGRVDLCAKIRRKSQRSHRNSSVALSRTASRKPTDASSARAGKDGDPLGNAPLFSSSDVSQHAAIRLPPLQGHGGRVSLPGSSFSQPSTMAILDETEIADIILKQANEYKRGPQTPHSLAATDPSDSILQGNTQHQNLFSLAGDVNDSGPPYNIQQQPGNTGSGFRSTVLQLFSPDEARHILQPSLLQKTARNMTKDIEDEVIQTFLNDNHQHHGT